MNFPAYTGRFAPSPSGPLHIGSLIAAVASFLEARCHNGRWLVRIEDIDAPRTIPGSASTILDQLAAHGLEWDGEVLWQSWRLDAYQEVLDQLREKGIVYPCACSRKEIADSSLRAPDGSFRYPGTCRQGLPKGKEAHAWRVRSDAGVLAWQDLIQGPQQENVWETTGDFVLRRGDAQFAYQLAVVVDDARQGVTHVVRGADLLDSTARQILLQRLLGYPQPEYAHLPVATNQAGEKLSKQTLATPIDIEQPVENLWRVVHFLAQNPPPALRHASLEEFWQWAFANWDLTKVPRSRHAVITI